MIATPFRQFFRGFLEFGQSSNSSLERSDVFELIEELYRVAPGVLLYVVPMLESLLEVYPLDACCPWLQHVGYRH